MKLIDVIKAFVNLFFPAGEKQASDSSYIIVFVLIVLLIAVIAFVSFLV